MPRTDVPDTPCPALVGRLDRRTGLPPAAVARLPGFLEVDRNRRLGWVSRLFAAIHVTRQRRGMVDLSATSAERPPPPMTAGSSPRRPAASFTLHDGSQQYGCNVPPMTPRCAATAAEACPHLVRWPRVPLRCSADEGPPDSPHRRHAGQWRRWPGRSGGRDPGGVRLLKALRAGLHRHGDRRARGVEEATCEPAGPAAPAERPLPREPSAWAPHWDPLRRLGRSHRRDILCLRSSPRFSCPSGWAASSAFHITTAFIHILALVIAVILIVLHFMRGRSAP